LLELSRSTYYYEPRPIPQADIVLAAEIDRLYMDMPFYGSRRMSAALAGLGCKAGRRLVARLMREMGLEAIYPKPRLSLPGGSGVERHPYLLRGLTAARPNHVWSADITYIPMKCGHMYLVAVMDWYSRYVLSWKLSNTLDLTFCVDAYEEALRHGTPEIHNTDQGCQFTSREFVESPRSGCFGFGPTPTLIIGETCGQPQKDDVSGEPTKWVFRLRPDTHFE
jgi:putative transposase